MILFTATTIHPVLSGPLTLEIITLGSAPVLHKTGMSIVQLIIEGIG